MAETKINKGRTTHGQCGDYIPYQKTLSFPCYVKGKRLTATVIGTIHHPSTIMYRVQFSDGYVSDFYYYGYWQDEANDKEYLQKTAAEFQPYANAIQKELDGIFGFNGYDEFYCFTMPVDGMETNIFVKPRNNGDYSINYNGAYQFSLKQVKGGWEAYTKTVNEKLHVSQEFARNVSLMIESKL